MGKADVTLCVFTLEAADFPIRVGAGMGTDSGVLTVPWGTPEQRQGHNKADMRWQRYIQN